MSQAAAPTYRVTLSPRDPRRVRPAAPGAGTARVHRRVPRTPSLSGPRGDFVVLDPAGGGDVPGLLGRATRAARARAYAVAPADWPAWQALPPGVLARRERRAARAASSSTRPCASSGRATRSSRRGVDLSPALAGGLGQAIVVVEPPSPSRETPRPGRARVGAVDAHRPRRVRRRRVAPRLGDGARRRPPARAASRSSLGGAERPARDASGLARLALADTPAPLLVARARRRTSRSCRPRRAGGTRARVAGARAFRDSLRFCVFDDRQMYRPGEEVRVKGWLRRVGGGPDAATSRPLPAGLDRVAWTLRDSRGNDVAKGEARAHPARRPSTSR